MELIYVGGSILSSPAVVSLIISAATTILGLEHLN